MRILTCLPLVLFAPVLMAQDPDTVKVPRPPVVEPDIKYTPVMPPKEIAPGVFEEHAPPGTVLARKDSADAILASLPAALRDPEQLSFDEPGDGTLWGGSFLYKMKFDGSGATFIPFLGSDAPDNYPIHFALRTVTVAGQALELADNVQPTLAGQRVTFARGPVAEHYDLRGRDMEQLFVIDNAPARGEIAVSIDVTTDLRFSNAPDGFYFSNQHGTVRYGRAVAIDANGNRLALESSWGGDHIDIRVPAWFVSSAAFPLTIDPIVGGTISASSGLTGTIINPDVTYDATNNRYFFVFERIFSATDHDVYGVEFTSTGGSITGSRVTVDFTTRSWQRPRTANNNIANRYLTVAQVSQNTSSPFWIMGRARDAGGTTQGTQFDIARAGTTGHLSGDKVRPDVGGDPHPSPPTYFTVVWERIFSASDHDIHLKQVTRDLNPTLRSASPTLVDNATTNETNPSISNTCGLPPAGQQDWAIVYQRTFSSSDEDIRGYMLHWDGGVTAANFSLDFSSSDDENPTASSLTETYSGDRYFLAAYNGGTVDDIFGRVGTRTGNMLSSRTNLNVLDGQPSTWPSLRPAADTDGCEFVVAYEELFGGSGSDWDIRVSSFSFHRSSTTISIDEARAIAAFSGTAERTVKIASESSVGETGSHDYGVALRDDRGTADDVIEGRRYVNSGEFVRRNIGCGTVALNITGGTTRGSSVAMSVNAPASAILFGIPNPSPPTVCGPCQLGLISPIVFPPVISFSWGTSTAFCGVPLGFQSVSFAGGPCGGIQLGDLRIASIH